MHERLGSKDQGETGCVFDPSSLPATPVLLLLLLAPGVGEEENCSSSPGLFQLALEVPGVGLESRVPGHALLIACELPVTMLPLPLPTAPLPLLIK